MARTIEHAMTLLLLLLAFGRVAIIAGDNDQYQSAEPASFRINFIMLKFRLKRGD